MRHNEMRYGYADDKSMNLLGVVILVVASIFSIVAGTMALEFVKHAIVNAFNW